MLPPGSPAGMSFRMFLIGSAESIEMRQDRIWNCALGIFERYGRQRLGGAGGVVTGFPERLAH
jgi:hypothetical protein